MAWIAIDAGTSVIKAVAFGHTGRVIGLARENTEVLHPQPEFSEQSMTSVWSAAVDTVRRVVAMLQEPIEGLCITAQGDGCWLIDENGQPTGNALLWNDGRSIDAIERWRSAGAIDRAYRRSGSVSYPGLSNALLSWLADHAPQRLQKSRWVLSCNGWLFAQLTGRFVTDLSDASNPFSEVQTGTYSDEVFAVYGLRRFRHLMPEVARGKELCATLGGTAAGEMGLPEGTAVIMAPYDIVSTAYGAGVTSPGQACLILGTTICAEAITANLDFDGEPRGTTIALESGLHLRAMPTLAGCETLEWAARVLGGQSIADLEALAAGSPPGARGLLFLPYLSEAGERSPFLDPKASGSFHGLKLSHGRADMARAVYEGLSYVIRECTEAAANHVVELSACGGGARSSFWCQTISDTTGLCLRRPAEAEIGARGALLFGLAVMGKMPSIVEAADQMPVEFDRFSPSAAREFYARGFQRFLQTRDLVRNLWRTAGESSAVGSEGA
jgi:erythritol kinase (D-erythritol 1-phosphate-forming)